MVEADYTGMYEQLLKEAEIPNVGLVQRLILETDDEWNSLNSAANCLFSYGKYLIYKYKYYFCICQIKLRFPCNLSHSILQSLVKHPRF